MQSIANDLWTLRYPLSILGANFGRTTTVIRLGGELLIHSSAPFTSDEVEAVRKLGKPTWLVEATGMHDTFMDKGLAAFPGIAYYVPDACLAPGGVTLLSLSNPPAAWRGQIDVIALQGLKMGFEHVFLHRASRTLVLADVIFNLPPDAPWWTRFILRTLSGLKTEAGVSRLYMSTIKDRAAFSASMEQVLEWDFDRVVVGHGTVIETGGKAVLRAALEKKGLLPG